MPMRHDAMQPPPPGGRGAGQAPRAGLPVWIPVTLIGLALTAAEARAFTYLNGAVVSVEGPYTGPSGNNFNRELFDDFSPDGTSRGSAAVTAPSGGGPLADAGAEVSHGVVRARTYATLSSPGVYQGGASMEAGFSDELTFTASGLTGLQGTVTLGMRVDGTLSSGSTQAPTQLKGGSEASVSLDAESNVDDQGVDRYAYSSSDDGWNERLDDELFTVTVNFVFGDPLDVDVSLRISSNVWGDSSPSAPGVWAATGIADFRHTATWAGILDLRDAEGDPVEAFDVTSASGTDYRGAIAVPEPGRGLLLLVGGAVLLATRLAGSLRLAPERERGRHRAGDGLGPSLAERA